MNLLITGAWADAYNYIKWIEELGKYTVRFMQYESDELPCDYNWVEGVICNGLFLKHPIEKFVNLKYIQLTSAGFDRVPIDYVEQHNITIYNAKDVYSIPMAEFALAGVLCLYKQMALFEENQKKQCWKKNRDLLELYGRTVCIIGCGSVGTECAKRFLGFGCEVIGVDLFPRDDCFYSRMVHLSEFDKELSHADILVFTLPFTKETKHMMNKHRFSLLKNNAIIVNIARGGIIDTEALITALPQIGGAVLDVFEEEPLNIDSVLWKMERVVITPHNSFVGNGNATRLSNVIIGNLIKNRDA